MKVKTRDKLSQQKKKVKQEKIKIPKAAAGTINSVGFSGNELTRRLTPLRLDFTIKEAIQNGFYRKTIIIKNFPSNLQSNCYLANISKIKNTSFKMCLVPMTTSIASAIDKQFNAEKSNPLASKKISENIKSDINKNSMASFYRQAQEKQMKAFYVNIYIEIYGKSLVELNENFLKVKTELSSRNITFEELTYEQKEGFLSVNPLGKDKFKMVSNNMPSKTIAALYPFSHSARNDEKGLLLGETIDGADMFVDFYLRDEDITNGNFTIIGIPGQGKSWLMKKILSQLIITGVGCYVLDPEAEYGTLFKKLGGTVIDSSDGKIKINPFEVRRLKLEDEEYDEKEDRVEAFTFAKMFFQHLSWLKDFFSVLYPDATPTQLKALILLTQEMYNHLGIDENTDYTKLNNESYPTFSDLYHYMEDILDNYKKEPHKIITEDMMKELLLIIKSTYDGDLGYLFNGYTNIKDEKNICFNIKDLLDGAEERTQAVIFNIMTYVWSKMSLRERYICLAVDELSLIMNRKNYIIAQYLKNFTKRSRKYDALIGTATQNINDYLDSEIYHLTAPIFNNTTFKFVFFCDTVEQDQVQRLLKLTEGEMERISLPHQKYCILKAGKQSYYMKVGELEYEHSLFGKAGGR